MGQASGFLAKVDECEGKEKQAGQNGKPGEIGHTVILSAWGDWQVAQQTWPFHRQRKPGGKREEDPDAQRELARCCAVRGRDGDRAVGYQRQPVAPSKQSDADGAKDKLCCPPAFAAAQTIKMTGHEQAPA